MVNTISDAFDIYSGPGIGAKGYFVNVASNQNGIGYGQWTHLDGWSENLLAYIQESETEEQTGGVLPSQHDRS